MLQVLNCCKYISAQVLLLALFVLALSSCGDGETNNTGLNTAIADRGDINHQIPNGGTFYLVRDRAERKWLDEKGKLVFKEIIQSNSDTTIQGKAFLKVMIEEDGKQYLDHLMSKNEPGLNKYQLTNAGDLVHIPLLSEQPFLNEVIKGDLFAETIFMQSTLYRLDSTHLVSPQSQKTDVQYTAFIELQAIDSELDEVLSRDTIVLTETGGPVIYSFEGERFQNQSNSLTFYNF